MAESAVAERGSIAMKPRRRFAQRALLALVILLVAGAMGALPALAGEAPRSGGELVFVIPAEPPSYDAHREETFALIHPAAPHYSTLLRVDPADRSGTKVIGDLAESWSISRDGRSYTIKLRQGVKFHDGSELTSKDVKASYDKIISPPAGVASSRKGEYVDVESVQAPDPSTVVFRMKWPTASFLSSLASPWNWIYKADLLAKDMRWYEKNIMGTGPFTFVEHVKGSHWVGKKNPNYWDQGKPYLSGYRGIFIRDSAAQVAAIRGERAMIQFRGFSPAERDSLVQALGNKLVVQESPWDCALWVAINHEKKPFDDKRVRRALSLAMDRYQGSQALSKIAIVKEVAGVMVPGTPFATPPAELEKLAGYGRDIAKSRAEAKRLLREAGVPDGFAFTFKNRGIPMPYEPVGIWLLDQWRQIGLNAKHEVIEPAKFFAEVRGGNYEVAIDFQCGYIVEPDLDLYKFQSKEISHANYGRFTDKVLDELYVKQARATDPEERKRYIREFEKRLLDDEAHYLITLQWHRIIPHSAKVKGWTITPSHYLNQQLDRVWLAE
jgi:peptide/nickel transport system substrate-binding protein